MVVLPTDITEHEWLPWKFERVQDGYWQENAKKFLDWLGQELNVKHLRDWHFVPLSVIALNGGSKLIRQYGGKIPLLTSTFTCYYLSTVRCLS